jgi:hypothetical protein
LKRQDRTLWDDDAREPVGKVARDAEVTLQAQISWRSEETKAASEGPNEFTEGYALFRRYDLDAAGIDLEQGDQIASIGTGIYQRLGPWYLYMFQYRGHWDDVGGHTLVKAWFTSKSPNRLR